MFVVPSLFGKPIYAWLGLLLVALTAFQVSSGLTMVRRRKSMPKLFPYHRANGITIGTIAAVHAFFAISAYFFGVHVQGF